MPENSRRLDGWQIESSEFTPGYATRKKYSAEAELEVQPNGDVYVDLRSACGYEIQSCSTMIPFEILEKVFLSRGFRLLRDPA